MCNIVRAVLLCGVAAFVCWPQATARAQTVVTAAQVNGTWRSKSGSFKVWALGGGKLRVEFSGAYTHDSPAGPMANTGEGAGVARIEGTTAIFKPEGADEECRITLTFERARLLVKQAGACGFGLNVTAEGTYRRVSRRKPKFD